MKLTVQTNEKCYPVIVEEDSFSLLPKYIDQCFHHATKILIVVDKTVLKLHDKKIHSTLENIHYNIEILSVEAGEKLKTIEKAEQLYHYLATHSFSRKDVIIALGGGTVGDLVGFVASTYMRGIHFINIPTTLLSQVDSSVGGKNALNLNEAKNVVGTFYQPQFVLIDTHFLSTLDTVNYQSGVAEIIKIAAILDENLFYQLSSFDSKSIVSILYQSIDNKRKVVEKDEKETQYRMILNFGHTLGHAFEKLSNYQLSHGIAVGIGMVTILKIANNEGWISNTDTLNAIIKLLDTYHMPISYPYPIDLEQLLNVIKNDKKNKLETITIILSEKIGSCFLKTLSLSEFLEAIKRNEDQL